MERADLLEANGAIFTVQGKAINDNEDGFLNEDDRALDVITSGGESIYSVQLENLGRSLRAANPVRYLMRDCFVVQVRGELRFQRAHALRGKCHQPHEDSALAPR